MKKEQIGGVFYAWAITYNNKIRGSKGFVFQKTNPTELAIRMVKGRK
jgi:hypothetical protein